MPENGTLLRGGKSDLLTTGAALPMPPADGGVMQRMQGRYATAISVQKPRVLRVIQEELLKEADLAGETFYYGWGAGKDRVEGASVNLAMSAVRIWGNCAVELQPVQETRDAWIFTAAFVDLETGFTLSRQFRQAKNWTVHGKFDEARKEDIRFQIGQSKAIRNVVLNVMPKWLTDRAVERAKDGVRRELEEAIGARGIDSVRDVLVKRLATQGVTDQMLLGKFGRPTVNALTVEDMVIMRADYNALHGGADTIDHLYPPQQTADQAKPASKSDALADRLAPSASDAEPAPVETTPKGMSLRALRNAIKSAETDEQVNAVTTAAKASEKAGKITSEQFETLWQEAQDRKAALAETQSPDADSPSETIADDELPY